MKVVTAEKRNGPVFPESERILHRVYVEDEGEFDVEQEIAEALAARHGDCVVVLYYDSIGYGTLVVSGSRWVLLAADQYEDPYRLVTQGRLA